MAASKITALVGTEGLNKSDGLLVYNSKTFEDQVLVERLGIQEDNAESLAKEPTIDTVASIKKKLLGIEGYKIIKREESDSGIHFIFNNYSGTYIDGQGFNVLIYLKGNDILGFTVLLSAQGFNVKTSTTKPVALRKNYSVKEIHINLSNDGNNIRVGRDLINLLDTINQEKRDYSGPENYDYYSVSDFSKNRWSKNPSYSIHLGSILKDKLAKNIFTDSAFCKIESAKNVVVQKLNIEKYLALPLASFSSNYDEIKFQVGIYSGDLVLYVWKDLRYSIFSLTKTMNSIFSENAMEGDQRPYPYTSPRKDSNGVVLSNSEIYTIPYGVEIVGFSGKYVKVNVGDEIRLFDIDQQEGEVGLDEKPGEKNNGWVVDSYTALPGKKYYILFNGEWVETTRKDAAQTVKFLKYASKNMDGKIVAVQNLKPNYLTNFILDTRDSKNRVIRTSDTTWSNYINAAKDIDSIAGIRLNYYYAIRNDAVLIGKEGNWHIFEEGDSLIYTNCNKVIRFSKSSEEVTPIVLNDQVLLTIKYEKVEDKDTTTFTLYNEPGYFVSERFFNSISEDIEKQIKNESKINREMYGSDYKRSKNTLTIDSDSLPYLLQSSFFSAYRRNVLPETLDNFRIIGAFGGIIFYRIGNVINYL